jgi:hypothetical protein
MPRNRLLSQIDEELVTARNSLKFWRDQLLLLADTEYGIAAKKQVVQRESEINRLLETQEILLHIARARASSPAASPISSRPVQ